MAMFSSYFFHGKKKKQPLILRHPTVPQELLLIPLSIPPEDAVEPTHLKLFQSSTLSPDSPPLDEQAAEQALKWSNAGYQFSYPFHFEAHLIFGPWSSPQYGFFGSIGH